MASVAATLSRGFVPDLGAHAPGAERDRPPGAREGGPAALGAPFSNLRPSDRLRAAARLLDEGERAAALSLVRAVLAQIGASR